MDMNKPGESSKNNDERIRDKLRASGLKFIRIEHTNPDEKEAARRVGEHAGYEFDSEYACEADGLQREGPGKDERADTILEELRAYEEQRKATQPYRIVPAQCIAFWEWTRKDQSIFCTSLIFMVIVLSAGAANVFSAIQAESVPVFLEQPILAVLLSCLLPSASIAFHSFAEFLESDRQRQQYNKLIAALTFVFVTIWAFVFGAAFQIGDNTLYAETLSEPADHTSVVFTIIQLLAELFCGTSLALIATHIHSRYSKEITVPNPEAQALDQRIAQAKARYEVAQNRQRTWGRLEQLKAMRALHVTEMVALYWALRKQSEAFNKLTY